MFDLRWFEVSLLKGRGGKGGVAQVAYDASKDEVVI